MAAAGAHGVAHHSTTGIDNRKLLMWIFLASECLFFGSLISTYLIFKGKSLVGPYPDEILDIPVTSISTFVLLMSSLAMVLAVYGAEHGRPRMMKLWLLVTILLGLTFLGFQVYEFRTFGHEGLNLATNQFGASFFVLTGFHGTHVGVGVLILASLLLASFRRSGLGREAGFHVEIAGLYWHFVDIVWIVIFTLVYLIPQ
ncbi:MAG: cytochrome c oxidase subunit 3 [Candidatus Rokubacteria bacterium]|nr:cytochrome oxidase subunit III [Chloroflexota bacterium]MBM4443378.1 cytochrome c oxidase subunit 3 [Candidatus Rokubacteria bacterium]